MKYQEWQEKTGEFMTEKTADTACCILAFTLAQDTSYQKYRPEGVTTVQPQKKTGGKELTPEQKQSNRVISSFRAGGETYRPLTKIIWLNL
jgi:hypothetical protein